MSFPSQTFHPSFESTSVPQLIEHNKGPMFKTITLHDWQQRAVTSWVSNQYLGTLHVFTGGGKSLMALQCYFEARKRSPDLQLVLIVPTVGLVEQWKQTMLKHTTIPEANIGMLGGSHKDGLHTHSVLITTLQSAYKSLPQESKKLQGSRMLIVDECHKAGSSEYSNVLNIEAEYRLGLSATPDRDEEDALGNHIDYNQQIVGQKLGPIVYTFSLKEAREIDWLPSFQMFHHGVELNGEELFSYRNMTEDITDALEVLQAYNINPAHAQRYIQRPAPIGSAAKTYSTMVKQRKHLLYKSTERNRIATQIIQDILKDRPDSKIIIFHERQDLCGSIYDHLRTHLPPSFAEKVGMEHSGVKPAKKRQAELQKFRTGEYNVLVSVKTLVEGIDVPDADVGIAVASSSSVRQRVQTFGRVLRRRFDGVDKEAQVHMLYVSDTVDESIYGKLDWRDLTGPENNTYLKWGLNQTESQKVSDAPRQPLLLDEDAFQKLTRSDEGIDFPQRWLGDIPDHRFSVDFQGLIQNSEGIVVTNPQGVPDMLQQFHGRQSGKVYVTSAHHLVLAYKDKKPFVIGQIQNPFSDVVAVKENVDIEYTTGDEYFGPDDKQYGEWKNIGRGLRFGRRNFAVADAASETHRRNYQRLRESANGVNPNGLKFFINSQFDAFYPGTDGKRYFLCSIQGGLEVDGATVFGS